MPNLDPGHVIAAGTEGEATPAITVDHAVDHKIVDEAQQIATGRWIKRFLDTPHECVCDGMGSSRRHFLIEA